ncbi:MAG: hypothetical protein A2X94_07920 [Bdellovibrionales bacterium GWB1_55_8]|nr:MAG: hypothetical protein A2X94_07920 [Bdellovibrionales bacterium GWB1_55_8]
MRLPARILENGAFLFENPGLVPRIVKNYLLTAAGRRPLRTVDITNTYRCNMSCAHCYARGLEASPRVRTPLNEEQLRKVVDACIAEGAVHFNLIGGEPTLDSNLMPLLEYIKARKAVVSLTTNGSLLSEQLVAELRRLRLDLVLLSLDGLDDSAENYHGNPFQTGAMAALENCLARGQRVYVSSILTPQNLRSGQFAQLLTFCETRKILLHVNLPALFGEWDGHQEVFLTDEDKAAVRRVFAHRYVRSCEMSAYFGSRCRSGMEKAHITLYGDVMPCTFVPISFGNILTDDLSAIRKKMFASPLLSRSEEMCLPSTSANYSEFYRRNLSGKQLPVSVEELPK